MSENILVDLSFEFAKNVVTVTDSISASNSFYMINQFARAGTSVGANIREAQYAHSRADFIAKLEIALKEANEAEYWLELMAATGRINKVDFQKLKNQSGKIRRLLIASCTTARTNPKFRSKQ